MRIRTTAIAALVTACAVLPAFSVVVPTEAHAQPPAPAGPSQADITEAKARFEKGSNLYKADKFAEALAEFRASYARVNSPNSHLYVARCLVKTGKVVDGYLEYEKVSAEASTAGEKYAQTGETAKTEHDELNGKLALVSVNVSTPESGAKLTIGGTEVPQDRWGKPFPAMPGSVEVRLEAPSKPAASQSVSANAGESKDVSIGFAAATPGEGEGEGSAKGGGMSGLRIGSFVAAGVGVAGFALFAVEGSMSQSTYDQLKKDCNGPCPTDRAADVDKGKMQQTLANVGLVVGAVGIAAGATLFVLSLKGGKKADTEPHTSLIVGPTSLGLRGTF